MWKINGWICGWVKNRPSEDSPQLRKLIIAIFKDGMKYAAEIARQTESDEAHNKSHNLVIEEAILTAAQTLTTL